MRKILYLLIGLIFIIFTNCFSTTSLVSTTGSIFIPTAKLLPDRGFNLGFFKLNVKNVNEIIRQDYELKEKKSKISAYSFNYGLRNIIEIGYIMKEVENNENEKETLLVAKYNITKETSTSPEISVGIIYNPDIKDEHGKERAETSLFAVATHTLSYPRKITKKYTLKGTIGIGNKILDEMFGAVELWINPNVSIISEYVTENTNFAIRIKLSEGFIFQGFSIKDNLGFLICVEAK